MDKHPQFLLPLFYESCLCPGDSLGWPFICQYVFQDREHRMEYSRSGLTSTSRARHFFLLVTALLERQQNIKWTLQVPPAASVSSALCFTSIQNAVLHYSPLLLTEEWALTFRTLSLFMGSVVFSATAAQVHILRRKLWDPQKQTSHFIWVWHGIST